MFVETVIGVGILVAVILMAKKILARNGGSSTPHTPIGGGGTIDNGSTGPNDGSVTPPKPEGENAQ